MAWEGSFIRCFTGSKAEYTLESELYALADCGENRITDMNNVQWAPCLFGRFLYTKFFLKNFYSHPNISLPPFGRYNGKGKGVKGEAINYYRHMDYRREHEAMFSELSEKELNQLSVMDEYGVENSHFTVHGYDIEVKDTLIAEALQALSERKRNVILLSYFLEMSDADIAREMNLVRSTIHEHRTRSLEILRKIMEEKADEKEM